MQMEIPVQNARPGDIHAENKITEVRTNGVTVTLKLLGVGIGSYNVTYDYGEFIFVDRN